MMTNANCSITGGVRWRTCLFPASPARNEEIEPLAFREGSALSTHLYQARLHTATGG